MREIFTYGSVGRAPGNRCLYPEADGVKIAVLRKGRADLELIWAAAHRRTFGIRSIRCGRTQCC